MARLRAVLRRTTGVAHQPEARGAVLRVGDLTMDEDTREVRRGDHPADADAHRVRAAALPHAPVADRC